MKARPSSDFTASLPHGTVGRAPVEVAQHGLEGLWTIRFGPFGCLDSEARGGVLHAIGDRVVGGDSNFVYRGEYRLTGTELDAAVHVIRHTSDTEFRTVFGTAEMEYQVRFIAEAITPDLFEGRLQRSGFPDARLTMRRLAAG